MRYIITLLIVCTTLTSCGDWLDRNSDGMGTNEDQLFKNENAFLNALTGVYTQLQNSSTYGKTLSIGALEFMGQNLQPQNTEDIDHSEFRYAAQSQVWKITWLKVYYAIASCNNILSQIETTNVVFNNKGQREIITGELYALRASLHFELLRLFHPSPQVSRTFVGMPYMTHFGSTVSEPLSTDALLVRITADLKHAEELLRPVDPILTGANTSLVSPGQIDSKLRTFFMNYYAVTAMLARVNLYNEKYAEALAYADLTLEHLTQVASRRQLFYFVAPGNCGTDFSFSREHIFGISSSPYGFTYNSDFMFVSEKTRATTQLGEIYDNWQDTRRREWFDGYGCMSNKFGKNSQLSGYTSVNGSENLLPARIPFIKLGEVVLIAAEATLRSHGEVAQAARYVVMLQDNRNLRTVKDLLTAGTLTDERLEQEIEAEYRRELFGEGQQFFYNKRLNKSQIINSKGIQKTVSPENYTIPIPK